MMELDKPKAVVFVHPNFHATSESLLRKAPDFFVEFLCGTTRSATSLIFTGARERWTSLRIILTQAGGFLTVRGVASVTRQPHALEVAGHLRNH